ncbi:MAG: energy transducer TonB [Sulfurospirillum sp.]|nr:energy transducer TonB [Campylobacteraceae bacterium]MBP9565778.1 energy transducer TonB [Sulfurospirillum sp.]
MVSYRLKGFAFSLLTHAIVIGGYFIFIHAHSIELMHHSNVVVVELATFERPPAPTPSIVEPTPLPLEPIKEVISELIKPVTHKLVLKPKPVVKKEVVRPVKEEVSITQEAVSVEQPVSVEPTLPIVAPAQSTPSEPYVKTDFEIIRDKVLSTLVYPSVAKRMNWNGVVHVALEIDTSGFLLKASIHQSSGRDILDNAALEAANRLKNQPLPKPQSASTVILPIAFKVR